MMNARLDREASLGHRQQQATGGADAGRLGRRGDSREDRTEDPDDQDQRGQQGDRHPLQRLSLECGDLGGRDRRRELRLPLGEDEEVDDVEADEHEARDHRADVEVADRHAHDVAQQDQDHAGREDLAERAGGADRPRDELLVVAAAEHRRQRDQAHRDHARPHDARGGGEDGAHDDDGDGDAAAQPAEEQRHRLEQLLREPGLLERHAHEDEEGHGEQGEVRHRAPDAERQEVEEGQPEADQAEDEAGEREAEGHREAGEEEDDHPDEHHGAERLIPGQPEHQRIF